MSYHTFQLRIKADQVAPPPNAPPCPLRGTSPKGKRLTDFSVACGSLRNQFACHPGGGSKFLVSPIGGDVSEADRGGAFPNACICIVIRL